MRAPLAVRALILPLALVPAFACGRSKEPAPVRPDMPVASASSAAPKHAKEEILAWLKATEVDEGSYARRTLYSWTTLASIDAIATSVPRLLLTKSYGNTGQLSGYDADVGALAKSDPLTTTLRDGSFAYHRYAWTAPWATALGLSDRTYGDRLVRIVLKEGALIARVSCHGAMEKPTCEPVRIVNLAGDPIENSEALAHPGRIAAAFHEHDGDGVNPHYREYVVLNESQIDEWSIGTPLIREGLDRDQAMLDAIRPLLQPLDEATVVSIWAHGPQPDDVTQAYAASLAFANARYVKPSIEAITKALAPPDPERDPLTIRPTSTWSPSPLGTAPAPMGTPSYPKKPPFAT